MAAPGGTSATATPAAHQDFDHRGEAERRCLSTIESSMPTCSAWVTKLNRSAGSARSSGLRETKLIFASPQLVRKNLKVDRQ
jgi:hypothetical protein